MRSLVAFYSLRIISRKLQDYPNLYKSTAKAHHHWGYSVCDGSYSVDGITEVGLGMESDMMM